MVTSNSSSHLNPQNQCSNNNTTNIRGITPQLSKPQPLATNPIKRGQILGNWYTEAYNIGAFQGHISECGRYVVASDGRHLPREVCKIQMTGGGGGSSLNLVPSPVSVSGPLGPTGSSNSSIQNQNQHYNVQQHQCQTGGTGTSMSSNNNPTAAMTNNKRNFNFQVPGNLINPQIGFSQLPQQQPIFNIPGIQIPGQSSNSNGVSNGVESKILVTINGKQYNGSLYGAEREAYIPELGKKVPIWSRNNTHGYQWRVNIGAK